jgi:ATP-dependent Clp protease ATP-binding subunit ClpX
VLLSVMYDIPSRGDIAKCVISRETVLEHALPTLVPRDAAATSTRRPRQEKTA